MDLIVTCVYTDHDKEHEKRHLLQFHDHLVFDFTLQSDDQNHLGLKTNFYDLRSTVIIGVMSVECEMIVVQSGWHHPIKDSQKKILR